MHQPPPASTPSTPPRPEQSHGHKWHHTEEKYYCEFDRDDWVPSWKGKCKSYCPGEHRPRKPEVRGGSRGSWVWSVWGVAVASTSHPVVTPFLRPVIHVPPSMLSPATPQRLAYLHLQCNQRLGRLAPCAVRLRAGPPPFSPVTCRLCSHLQCRGCPAQYDCEEDRRPRWPKVPEWCIPEKPDYGKKVGFQGVLVWKRVCLAYTCMFTLCV